MENIFFSMNTECEEWQRSEHGMTSHNGIDRSLEAANVLRWTVVENDAAKCAVMNKFNVP